MRYRYGFIKKVNSKYAINFCLYKILFDLNINFIILIYIFVYCSAEKIKDSKLIF